MGKVIILEGPDGSGKTTLAKSLVKAGFRYKHEGPPPHNKDLVAWYLEILNESIESEENTVHDRLWLGERIYGPIARNMDRLGEDGQILFQRLHSSKQVHQYICLPSMDIVRANYAKKITEANDYLKSMTLLDKVFDAYAKWVYSYGSANDIFDYTQNFPEQVIDHIGLKDHILPIGTVGNKRAKMLFIGDRPNHPSIDVPFHALTGSSGYLNKALKLAYIKEEELALSNAFGPKGEEHSLSEILRSLPDLRHVFLMGNAAREWYLNSTSVWHIRPQETLDIHQIPHPSFLKRFKGNNPQILADEIKEKLQWRI